MCREFNLDENSRGYHYLHSWLPTQLIASTTFLNEKLPCNICSGEAGRDHRGAVQRRGERGNRVPPKCWGVGGGPGGMVGHLNAYQP